MIHPFDLPLPSGEKIGSAILAPVLMAEIDLQVVDVGARSGMFFLPGNYTSSARLIGFEPNQPEYQKLVNENTDAMLASGIRIPFKDKKYFNCAVWSGKEERDFFVTKGPGACTLMGPCDPVVTDRMYLNAAVGTHKDTYRTQHTEVVKQEKMLCDSLDNMLGEESIDFLKIDIEGAELQALHGAEKLLAKGDILFIKTEFINFPYYAEHPVFGSLHVYLNDRNYRLIDMDLDQPGYSRSVTSIPDFIDRRVRYAGDAYFILDPDRSEMDPMTRHRLAAISLALGFRSLAVSLLRDAQILPMAQIDEIEKLLSRIPLQRKLIRGWQDFPYTVQRWLSRIGLKL